MKQPTPIEWLQEVYKVTGALKESDFDYANNWTKEHTYTEKQVLEIIKLSRQTKEVENIRFPIPKYTEQEIIDTINK